MNRYVTSYTEKKARDNEKSIIELETKLLNLNSRFNKLDSEIRSYVEDKITQLTSIPQEWALDPDEECHIYFIRCTDKVKIGYSKNPDLRLRALQTANPHALELLYSFPSFTHSEKQIHEDLKDHHVHLEWFNYNDEVKNYINNIMSDPKHLHKKAWGGQKNKKIVNKNL